MVPQRLGLSLTEIHYLAANLRHYEAQGNLAGKQSIFEAFDHRWLYSGDDNLFHGASHRCCSSAVRVFR
jgi:hypothetical protein